jgi:hypothetical protein
MKANWHSFMKSFLSLTTLLIATCASAQVATPAPERPPFTGFGGSALDRKPPRQPSTALSPTTVPSSGNAPVTEAGALKLDDRWDALNALSDRGPKTQRQELWALLKGFAEPGKDTSPAPRMEIYRKVTYLTPLETAKGALGLTSQVNSGGPPSVVGFPPGLRYTAFSAGEGRSFEVRVLHDRASQVVAVEYVALESRLLPPPPETLPPPTRTLMGKTYDFVPRGDSSNGRAFQQMVWNRSDYVLIATRGGPKPADLYIPKKMVSLILYYLNLQTTN